MHKLSLTAVVSVHAAVPLGKNSQLKFLPLSCQIEPSSLTCLVGPHRLQLRAYLQMLTGITQSRQGKVEIFGQQVSQLTPLSRQRLRSHIGYLSGTAPLLSVEHGLMNVMLPALYHGKLSFRATADKARALLNDLGCHFDPVSDPALLDSFQRLQLALARALILDPALLILDVPFHDLGAQQREQMGIMLGKYCQQRAICMIGGLQYTHFLEEYATQIIYISETKITHFNSWETFMQTKDQDINELLSGFQSIARTVDEH